MKKLRPIGTEFWYDYGVDEGSADTRGCRVLYRVDEHVWVSECEYKPPHLAETWEPIKVEKYDKNPSTT